MPYIPDTRRFDIDEALSKLPVNGMGPSEYNYKVSSLSSIEGW